MTTLGISFRWNAIGMEKRVATHTEAITNQFTKIDGLCIVLGKRNIGYFDERY